MLVASVDEVSDPLAAGCTPVPSSESGICEWCRRPCGSWDRCYSCNRVDQSVSRACEVVIPISLMAKQNSQLYATLKDYKRAVDTPTRRQARSRIAALVARFIRDHGACIEAIGGAWDVITHVPSTSGRAGIHPLVRAFELVPGLSAQHETLLNRASGAVAHQVGDDEAFVVTRDVTDLRVLLIDDTWTTGARAQSAASALTLAGATVVAIVVVGRLISGDRDDDWYEDQRALGFDFDKCCVHIP